jgi:peptidoglycan/LPS O-acetylase OafA/YrhL
MREQLYPLTGLRGLASAWVVLLHLQLLTPVLMPHVPVLSRVISGGNLGVDIFFMLSGLVITYTYLEKLAEPAPGALKTYLWLRVARIYPIHLATMLLVLCLVLLSAAAGSPPEEGRRFTPVNFVMNLFMLQAVPPALAWNDPAWSISTEFAAYLVFPLLAPVLIRLKPRSAVVALVTILCAGMVLLLLITYSAHEWPYWSGYALMWARIAICFPVGALLCVFWRANTGLAASNAAWMVPVSLAGIAVVSLLTPPAVALDLPVLAYPFIVLLLFGAAGGLGACNRALSTRFMQWSGRISYSVYLIHFPALLVVGQIVGIAGVEAGSPLAWVLLLLAFFAIAGAGAALYSFVEEPARKLIRRWTAPHAIPERG